MTMMMILFVSVKLLHTDMRKNGTKATDERVRIDASFLLLYTGDGDCEVKPSLTKLVLGETRVSPRIVLEHSLDLQRITLQLVSAIILQ